MASTLPSPRRGTVQEQIDELRAILSALYAEVERATAREGSRPALILIPGGRS